MCVNRVGKFGDVKDESCSGMVIVIGLVMGVNEIGVGKNVFIENTIYGH